MRLAFQQSGSLADEVAPVKREAFGEILARRARGANDDDLDVSGEENVDDGAPGTRPIWLP